MDKAAVTLELRDIHLPDTPSYWPLAPGWWLLIMVSLVVFYFIYNYLKQKRKNRHLNYIMQQQLQAIQSDFKKHNNKHILAADISELLKRFVRHILKNTQAASLTGDTWVHYLNQQVDTSVFDKFKTELTQAQYVPHLDYDAPSFLATVKNYFPAAIKGIKNA